MQAPPPTLAARMNGTVPIDGLDATVTITRDALGIPTIRGENILDVITAQGFIHAQDRFFQMDLGRRYAVGELAALIGPELVSTDERMRRLGLREVARTSIKALDAKHLAFLEHYTNGVNAGLRDLSTPPLEYTFLRAAPAPWQVEDSLLVILSMWDALNQSIDDERMYIQLHDALSEELLTFLTPIATRFDSPLLPPSGEVGDNNEYTPLAIPSVEVMNVRRQSHAWLDQEMMGDGDNVYAQLVPPHREIVPGSNCWAVAGSRSTHGGAILANDPHLLLSAPVAWYRVELEWPDGELRGVSLPGVPAIVIGSNGHVSWGFTNTTADFQDLVIIEPDPNDPARYLTPEGSEPFLIRNEVLHVRDAQQRNVQVRTTRWGPMIDAVHALRWTALDDGAVDIALADIVDARTVEDAVAVLRRWKGPSQNAIVADKDGRIGWVVTGALPKRRGFSGALPVSWADGRAGWDGNIPEHERPMVLDPPNGVIYTANNRTVSTAQCKGFASVFPLGVRASRIAELFTKMNHIDEQGMLAMQLDTRVHLLDWYHARALELTENNAELRPINVILRSWNGCADIDQQAFTFLRAFHSLVRQRIFGPMIQAAAGGRVHYSWMSSEEPLRRILEEQPMHLLHAKYDSYDALLINAVNDTIATLGGIDAIPTWGEMNIAEIQHPATAAAPQQLARTLAMPRDPLPGHYWALRVAAPSFGASMRMVVSPGHEDAAILHMPTGQSGHPLSPHFRDMQDAWVDGSPSPFRAGPARHTLTLNPVRSDPD
ncbi:MAG: penicillin acylase family protein [Phycisphaerales bacterium]